MSNPNPSKPDVLTAFDWVIQQAQGTGAPVMATHVYEQLDVAGFLELQAQAMRNHGFRATVSTAGPQATLIWTTVRNRAPGVVDATFSVKAVDGSSRPFRAQFNLPSSIEGEADSIVGVASHHLDLKVLGRWFAVFTDQALTAISIRNEAVAA